MANTKRRTRYFKCVFASTRMVLTERVRCGDPSPLRVPLVCRPTLKGEFVLPGSMASTRCVPCVYRRSRTFVEPSEGSSRVDSRNCGGRRGPVQVYVWRLRYDREPELFVLKRYSVSFCRTLDTYSSSIFRGIRGYQEIQIPPRGASRVVDADSSELVRGRERSRGVAGPNLTYA